MAKSKLYLGTIFIDRGAHPAFYISLAALAYSRRIHLTMSQLGSGDGAMRQLNRRCGEFLDKTTADYFWMQGNDTDFKPAYIERMAKHGLPMVGGLFPIKQPELRWCIQGIPGKVADPKTGLQEVRASGLECMLIHRDVLVAMQKARPDLGYRDNFGGPNGSGRQHHFWRWELRDDPGTPGEKILQSEDYLFCDEARDLGFKIMVDTTDYCGHYDGRTRFPLAPVPTEPIEETAAAPKVSKPAKAPKLEKEARAA